MSNPVRRPTPAAEGRWLVVIAPAALVVAYLVYVGWRTFWFLTDDAFIAFRYVSNSLLGHGWVWNPPPFQAVEGYTSFLWLLLLDGVWRSTGVMPPDSANWLSLGFGYATLAIGYRFVLRMTLPAAHERIRLLLLALIALGTVSNRSFLTWLSSGLETSLFNFALSCWIYFALVRRSERGSLVGLTGSAAAVALTRPDGLLFCAATLVLLALRDWRAEPGVRAGAGVGAERRAGAGWRWLRLVWVTPLLLVPLHLVWRFMTYGLWLPNTYYAKVTGPWPAAGLRHLACFALEYGLWVWLALALAAFAAGARNSRREPGVAARGASGRVLRVRASLWIVVAALVGQVGYYSLNVGGDHFEYRVYSYLIPWLFVSGAWLAARACARPGLCLSLVALFVLASWPIPWTHWSLTHNLETRAETRRLVAPIAAEFPPGVRSVVAQWDEWQAWLIRRSVGSRHQEHKIAYQAGAMFWPPRAEGARIGWEERAVLAIGGVGAAAWALPHVAIIDEFGLNDRVIANHPVNAGGRQAERQMAHERRPPERYVECFLPNVLQPYLFSDRCLGELMQRPVGEGSLWRGTLRGPVALHRREGQLSDADFGSCDRLILMKRPIELKDARIRACERRAWY